MTWAVALAASRKAPVKLRSCMTGDWPWDAEGEDCSDGGVEQMRLMQLTQLMQWT